MGSPAPTRSLLLIGPTGSGKTPLGDHIAGNGLNGRRCLHFDFGSQLRAVASHHIVPKGFSEEEQAFIRRVVKEGLLLENEQFGLAEKIIAMFIDRNGCSRTDILLLNGLPRHTDQAEAMRRITDVIGLIVLECSPEDVYKRISCNTGRDRTGRDDDGIEMIRKKLDIYNSRTAPLIDYYGKAGGNVFRITTTPTTTTEDLYSDILAVTAGVAW